MSDHAHVAHAHQFDSAEQQRQASMLGMWIFLLTEIMFFGAVFVAYAIYRGKFPDAFTVGTHLLDMKRGALNTVLLMTSSFTMTLAVLAARNNRKDQIVKWLIVTIVLAVSFLGVKGMEYWAKIDHGLVPGAHFHYDNAIAAHVHSTTTMKDPSAADTRFESLSKTADPGNVQMFFGFYFAMTGLHAIHMIIGIGVLLFILRMARQGRFNSEYYNPLEATSLYWHFVDMVWIFLFPALYLLGRHG